MTKSSSEFCRKVQIVPLIQNSLSLNNTAQVEKFAGREGGKRVARAPAQLAAHSHHQITVQIAKFASQEEGKRVSARPAMPPSPPANLST